MGTHNTQEREREREREIEKEREGRRVAQCEMELYACHVCVPCVFEGEACGLCARKKKKPTTKQ